jgi:hypothetical protein
MRTHPSRPRRPSGSAAGASSRSWRGWFARSGGPDGAGLLMATNYSDSFGCSAGVPSLLSRQAPTGASSALRTAPCRKCCHRNLRASLRRSARSQDVQQIQWVTKIFCDSRFGPIAAPEAAKRIWASLLGQVRIGPGAEIGKPPGNWRRITIATISMAGWWRPKSGVRSHHAAVFLPASGPGHFSS